MRALAMAAVAVVVLTCGCAAGTGGFGQAGTGEHTQTAEASTDERAQTAEAGTDESEQTAEPRAVKTGETCNGTELLTPSEGFPEVRGSAEDAELWGLLFGEVPFKAGTEVKVVWRMTGDGPVEASATGPGGKRAKLVWLQEHGGSSWRRPGDEWGTGWVFPEPGCWKVELSRTKGSGYAWLRVV
ncbi:MAG TPA: hypothetical protein VKZ82_07440 [Nonomuraea sp.]|nr:hypothetical protein [Nonomuraea sp.]